jgi:hypothetical protein
MDYTAIIIDAFSTTIYLARMRGSVWHYIILQRIFLGDRTAKCLLPRSKVFFDRKTVDVIYGGRELLVL